MSSPLAAALSVRVLRVSSRAVLATALLTSALVGCGDTGSPPPKTDDGLPPPLIVVADEYSYRPATLSAAGPLRVRLDNAGTLAHTWTVVAEPIEAEVDLVRELVIAEALTEPGQTSTVDLSALAPGVYQVVCAIPGHISAGMVGELIIQP